MHPLFENTLWTVEKAISMNIIWICVPKPRGTKSNDWMSKRLKNDTPLFGCSIIKKLYRTGIIYVWHELTYKVATWPWIQLIYVHIRKEPLPYVLQLTYTRCGMSKGRCAKQQDGVQLTRHVCIAGVLLPWYPYNPLLHQWSIFISQRVTYCYCEQVNVWLPVFTSTISQT